MRSLLAVATRRVHSLQVAPRCTRDRRAVSSRARLRRREDGCSSFAFPASLICECVCHSGGGEAPGGGRLLFPETSPPVLPAGCFCWLHSGEQLFSSPLVVRILQGALCSSPFKGVARSSLRDGCLDKVWCAPETWAPWVMTKPAVTSGRKTLRGRPPSLYVL